MNNRDNNNKRIESYPRPTQTDEQLKNQPEYIDEVSDSDSEKQKASDDSTKTETPKRDDVEER